MLSNDGILMTDSWENKVVENVLKVKGRIGWKGYKTSDLRESGPIVLSGTEIKSKYHIDLEGVKHLTQEKYDESPEIMLKDKDILVATRGSLGEIAIYRKEYGPATINPSLVILSEFTGVPEFLYYYLVSQPGQENLLSMASGSSVPAIYQADIRKLEIPFPKLSEQKAIADILSSLDDKIHLLHQNSKTLELMAEALFRQWFIVESKEEWTSCKLSSAIKIVGGGTPKTSLSEYWDGCIPWLSGGGISDNHKGFVFTTQKTISQLGLDNSSARLLPEFATVISARGTVGKYCLLGSPMTFSQSNYGILPVLDETYFFTYLLLAHSVEELLSSAYGSVFDTITTATFDGVNINLPSLNEIKEFDESVKPLFHKLRNNAIQIQTLSKTRDSIMPKLMSGQVKVTQ